MSILFLIATWSVGVLLMMGLTELPIALLNVLHFPQWLGLFITFLLVSWLMGE